MAAKRRCWRNGYGGRGRPICHTIGWFTTIYPVKLRAGASAGETLRETAALLGAVPHRGFGYQFGKSERPRANILFNFLGEFDQTTAGLEYFTLEPLDMAHWHAASARRTHEVEINGLLMDGQLEIRITYSPERHPEETIRRVAQAMTSALRQLAGAASSGAFEGVDESTRTQLMKRFPAAVDAYPLTSMQRLFLSMELARPGSGSEQWHWRLRGSVNGEALQFTWRMLMQRHAVLRTVYAADLAVPLQIVLSEMETPWHVADLRALPEDARVAAVQTYCATDTAKPFDLAHAPLTRLGLFRTGEDEQVLVWTHHHLQIDGWSWPILLREWDALLRENVLNPAPQYRDYAVWASRPRDEREFWRQYLAGFRAATPLPRAPDRGAGLGEVWSGLDSEGAERLNNEARAMRVTPGVLVQAAWALLLAHYSGRDEVVFGSAFSGRPADLPGAEAMVGHFVNNLPVRVRVTSGEKLQALAARLHRQLADLVEHQSAPLADVQACAELPWNERLFSTLVVYQNYPAAIGSLGASTLEDYTDVHGRPTGMPPRGLHPPVRTNYPLTLVVVTGLNLDFAIISQPGAISRVGLDRLVEAFGKLLKEMSSEKMVDSLVRALPPMPQAKTVVPSSGTPSAAETGGTTLERAIGEIWTAALGRAVSGTENFFDAGGHSLLMLRVHARLVEKLGREIPVVTLFQHPTIRSLARALGDGPVAAGESILITAQERAAKARAALARRPQPLRKP